MAPTPEAIFFLGYVLLQLLFPFQHQDSIVRYDVIFFLFINNFVGTIQQKYGEVSFLGLEWDVFYIVVFFLPGLLIFQGMRNRISGAGFYDITLLHPFLFLNARRQI